MRLCANCWRGRRRGDYGGADAQSAGQTGYHCAGDDGGSGAGGASRFRPVMHGDGGAAMSAVADVRPALMGHLKDLRLPAVRECYEDTARRAGRETLSYEQYLLEVISRECEQRRKSRVQRLLKDSALPLEKSLQNFDLKRLPAKAARQLRTLLDGSFLGRKENVLVFGNPGSGKSHLLTALAQELVVVRERQMHFTKCALLMQDLLARISHRLNPRLRGGAASPEAGRAEDYSGYENRGEDRKMRSEMPMDGLCLLEDDGVDTRCLSALRSSSSGGRIGQVAELG